MKRKHLQSRQRHRRLATVGIWLALASAVVYTGGRQGLYPWLVTTVYAQGSQAAPASKAAAPAERPIKLVRAPIRAIKDDGAVFTDVAVDIKHDEVILQDERSKKLVVYNRLDNTPPAASMTEPKRMLGGNKTKITDNCGVYVDPNNGDIYSLTGDTSDNLIVFTHDQKGNVPPVRELKTPHRMYGITADEGTGEMFITTQWPAAVFVYRKEAQGKEAPLRILEGSATQLAGAMGIAIDTKNQEMYVSNWGASSTVLDGQDYRNIPTYGEGDHRMWELPDFLAFYWRNRFVAGSGKFVPPSILTFPLKANGNVEPKRVIQGPASQLQWPTHMSIDVEHREFYVANLMDDSIAVYKATDSGNAAPIRMIKGPKTSIDHPQGVFFDAKNQELFVSNWGNHSATVYSRLANGDVAPIRKIRNAPEGVKSPMITHLGAMSYDTKRDQILMEQ